MAAKKPLANYSGDTKEIQSGDSIEVGLIPAAIAGGASGLLTGADKTKLDNQSNTNTGDQTLGSLGAEAVANKSTTTTLGTSDTLYPTQNAVKTYVDTAVTGLIDDRGNYDASGNAWPSTGGSGAAGAILKGDLWYISVAGTLKGGTVAVGSSIRALVDTPGSTDGNWDILNVGLGFTPENVANKSTSNTLGTSDTLYPTQKAVKEYVDNHVVALPTITLVASEALPDGGWVNFWNSSGTMKVRKADATTSGKECHGFVKATYSTNDSAVCYLPGQLNDHLTGQTLGPLFLSTTAGEGVSSAPSGSGNAVQKVGVVYSATAAVCWPNPNPVTLA
jgi:hypothetical protein